MDDPSPQDTLQYGHLGAVYYHPDTQTWEFARCLNRDSPLNPLGQQSVFDFGSSFPRLQGPGNEIELPRFALKEESLLKEYPELAPSLDFVNSHDKSSQFVTAWASNFDPLVSNRLAFGKALNLNEEFVSKGTIPIVVAAYADPAISIAIVPLELQKCHKEGIESSISIPLLDYWQGGRWKCPGGPVQQICFADSVDEENTLFAVRFPRNTTIFGPLHQRVALSSPFSTRGFILESQTTHYNPNPLIDIPTSLSGGHPHADVAFNPWYQRQVAIIDCAGNWSLWDIRRRLPREADWIADRGPCGSLVSVAAEDESRPVEDDHFDGWAAITWVENVHQILVCDRRNLALCQLAAQPPAQYRIDLRFQRDSEWILDLARSRSNPSQFFVLTTTRLLWLSTLPNNMSLESNHTGSHSVTTLLGWKHFRDIEDISLMMTQILVEDDLSIVISSRFNDLVQIFRFKLSPNLPLAPVSVSDPLVLSLPGPGNDAECMVNEFRKSKFSSVNFINVCDSTSAFDDARTESTLLKFVGQRLDLTLVEALYSTQPRQDLQAVEVSQLKPMKASKRVAVLSSTRVNEHDFIIDDTDNLAIQNTPNQQGGSNPHQTLQPQRIEQWINLHPRIIFCGNRPALDGSEFQTLGFDDWIGQAAIRVENRLSEQGATEISPTLLEVLGAPPPLDAIDANNNTFEELLNNLTNSTSQLLIHHQVSGLPLPFSGTSLLPVFTPVQKNDLSLSTLYDSLVHDWLSTLSPRVPNRVRVSKEKIIRFVVTEIMFSRVSLVRSVIDKPEETANEGGEVAAGPLSSENSGLFQDEISSEQANKPGTITSIFGNLGTTPYSFLQRYTPVIPASVPSKRVMTTISHWKTGVDPSNYNWHRTVQRVQDEQSQSEEPPASRRRRRRTESRSRQMEIVEKQVSLPPSTPRVVTGTRSWGSQPDRSTDDNLANFGPWSSQAKEEDIPSTQTERGAFGSRETIRRLSVRRMKPRRAAGF